MSTVRTTGTCFDVPTLISQFHATDTCCCVECAQHCPTSHVHASIHSSGYMFTGMHVHPFWSLSLSICALRHSSGWRTRLQESWRGRSTSGWSAFNDHQRPPTCTRNPRRSTVTASTQHHLHLTSLFSILTWSPHLHRCCLHHLSYLPLRQQRPRRTGSVTHRVPEHTSIYLV